MVKVVGWTAACSGVLLGAAAVEAEPLDRGLFPNDAIFELHRTSAVFRRCDVNRDGALQPAELSCYDDQRTAAAEDAIQPTLQVPTNLRMRSAAAGGESMIVPASTANKQDEDLGGKLLIRRSLDDVGSFAAPSDFADAAGAEFAWADNRIEENEVWSARGLIARPFVVHRGEEDLDKPYVRNILIAPYINFDRVSNSRNVAKDVDNLTYAGVVEASIANFLGATHYLDLSSDFVTSFGGEEKNWSVDLRWHPVGYGSQAANKTILSYMNTPRPLGRYFVWSVTPSAQAQYVSDLTDADTQPIFAERDEAFRIGPSVFLTVDGKDHEYFPQVPRWASRIHYQIAYSWLYDLLSGREYELLDTALKLSLDPAEHFGLTFSYRNGQLEATGQEVDLATVALSVSY